MKFLLIKGSQSARLSPKRLVLVCSARLLLPVKEIALAHH